MIVIDTILNTKKQFYLKSNPSSCLGMTALVRIFVYSVVLLLHLIRQILIDFGLHLYHVRVRKKDDE